MAVTKLLHLKEGKKTASSSLKSCIYYIFKDAKTEHGLWVGGNSGTTPEEVFQTMMDTKRFYEKENGRQGYHFIVAFEKGETDEATAYEVLKEWCAQYFGEDYEYVFSIHNDREHMHGHIVFNSVARSTGYKYRYENGDWEKYIQPVTDRICKEHGLSKLTYEKKRVGKSYAEHMASVHGKKVWSGVIKKDLDHAIARSGTYEEVLADLNRMGYQVREGNSKKYGEYLSLKAPGAGSARRTYNLGAGYSVQEIRSRVQLGRRENICKLPPKLKKQRIVAPKTALRSRYQIRSVKRLYRSQCYQLLNPYKINQAQVRKDLLHIEKLSRSCRYMLRQGITSPAKLQERIQLLQMEERILKNSGRAWEEKERNAATEYQSLKKELSELTSETDAFENVLDRMEELEAYYPESILLGVVNETDTRLTHIKEERSILRYLEKLQKESKRELLKTPERRL